MAEKADKKVEIKCTGADTAQLDELIVIQGEFKSLSKSARSKLKESILGEGFADPIRVWMSGGKAKKKNIIDGTQRLLVLTELRDEGYEIPPLPVDYISAKTRKEAIRKLIALSSRYGDITIVSVQDLLESEGIELDEIPFAKLPSSKMIELEYRPWAADKYEDEHNKDGIGDLVGYNLASF